MPVSFFVFESLLHEALFIDSGFRCYPDAMEYILQIREKRKRQQIIDEKYTRHSDNGVFGDIINANLFPYQKEGVCFAASAGRSLIADDMGLGKTIQAIAATELLRRESQITNTLIICPTSLKYQWKSEIEKFTGQKALVIEGLKHKRLEQYGSDAFYKIISYHALSNDIEYFSKTEIDLVILDEAQRIKNYKTKISANVKKVKSDYAIVLTGTPIENKLEELYSIMQFVEPFSLGPFYKFLAEHQIKNETGKVIGYTDLNQIGVMLADVMIRRKKDQVLTQLPERMDKNQLVPMTSQQMEIHEEYSTEVGQLINKWKRFGFLNEKDRQRLLIFLNMMRMACDSTYVIDQQTRHDTKIEELMNQINEVINQGDEKIVVFSQWERMTRLVAAELKKAGIGFEYLHGGIPSQDRQKLFDNFNNIASCRVFLSTDAGGVGLNLQAASMLVNLDIPWNPAVLEQRIARIYRLGQKRNVNIINFVSIGTIEHRMLDVLKFKSSMAEGVLDNGDDTIFMGESRFKQFMDSVEKIVVPEGSVEILTTDDESEDIQPANEVLSNSSEKVQDNDITIEQSRIETDEGPVLKTADEKVSPEIPVDLVTMGVSFFSRLAQTLSDKDATQKLVNSLVAKDEKSGQTYIKIPVENEKVVENALNLLTGLFAAIKK